MSRIEQVMREISDLRDFYLKLQQRHVGSSSVSSSLVVAEPASGYNPSKAKDVKQSKRQSKRRQDKAKDVSKTKQKTDKAKDGQSKRRQVLTLDALGGQSKRRQVLTLDALGGSKSHQT